MKESRVAVVGFGIAGATVASLLARQGHRVTAFERTDSHAAGAGLLLQPSGQLVLEALGVLYEVARAAEPLHRIVGVTASGRTLVRLVYAELGSGIAGLGVRRPLLLDVLARHALAAGVTLWTATAITGARSRSDGAGLDDASGGQHGPFDLVIGADGLHSSVREAAGLSRWTHFYRYGALWTVGRSSVVRNELRMITRGTQELLGLLPLGDGYCNFFWSQRGDRWAATRAAGLTAWRESVLRLSPLAEEAIAHVRDLDDLMVTSYGHVVTRSDPERRIVLLGDAAHAMSPHLGQGVNLALIDALELARLVAEASDVPAAIAAFGRRRHRQLRFYSWLTLGLTPFFQSDGVIKGLGRDIGLPIIQRLPYVRGRMTQALSGLAGGFRGDRIRLG